MKESEKSKTPQITKNNPSGSMENILLPENSKELLAAY